MAMYCHRCGTELPPSARFCSSCGTPVAGTPLAARAVQRPRQGRVIAGVCAGLARTYGWDINLVRVLAVVGALFSGGLVGVAYLAAWVGIPEEPVEIPAAYPPKV